MLFMKIYKNLNFKTKLLVILLTEFLLEFIDLNDLQLKIIKS